MRVLMTGGELRATGVPLMRQHLFPEPMGEVGNTYKAAKSINPPVPVRYTRIGDMLKSGLSIERPGFLYEVMEPEAPLRGKFSSLSNAGLGFIFVGIRVYNTSPNLKIRDKLRIGLYEIVADKTCNTCHIVTKSIKDVRIGDLR